MTHYKLHFSFSRNLKAQQLKKKILNKYKNFPAAQSDFIIVSGGDGFMLYAIKKYLKYNKPFYGINCGNVGFLMNDYTYKNIEKKINSSKSFLINPLLAQVTSYNKKIKKKLTAINDVSLLRQTKQTCSLRIKLGKKILIKKLTGDGILICTPVGSTAYNYSLGGPILTLKSGKLSITPISPFSPRNWKGKIVSQSSNIIIENVKIKRPVSLVADNTEIRNIKKIKVKISKKNKIQILFEKKRDYLKKIKELNL